MALRREVIEHLTDDIDGTKADESVRFSFDGKAYVIDLSKKNAAALRKAMGPYLSAARRDTGKRTTAPRASTSVSNVDLAAVREWATKEGHDIAQRGRIAKKVVDQYLAAHK